MTGDGSGSPDKRSTVLETKNVNKVTTILLRETFTILFRSSFIRFVKLFTDSPSHSIEPAGCNIANTRRRGSRTRPTRLQLSQPEATAIPLWPQWPCKPIKDKRRFFVID